MNKKQKINAYIVYWKCGEDIEFEILPTERKAKKEKGHWKMWGIPAKSKKCEISF